MAKSFSSLKELERYLNKQIQNTLQNEVFAEVKDTMQKKIDKDVYEAYTPYSTDGVTPHYQRTGKLRESIEKSLNGNTLIVENTRSENGRDIVEVIESGKGYTWGYSRNLNEEIGSRPFVESTKNELRNSNKLEQAMKKGLKKQGLSIE
ncbi:hypothetical protein [Cytobacillus praedii]|uniref:HK97 gp10 family phage protein n=1 Tax=Cytobacillus praedii TaxID=1742358 RepID=A0A4R1AVP7_9BACI|nr:hypothetical protein [Cytobacillus praedii]TCJ01087.1 hypothetical protein E0Y62_25815 [Cytobacillus praedii]